MDAYLIFCCIYAVELGLWLETSSSNNSVEIGATSTKKIIILFILFQVEIAFITFDTNKDDKLNYKEFCKMIMQKEQERYI